MPAAFSGCVGFRVSPGRTPTESKRNGAWGLHSISGPMARTVRDVGLFLDAMESKKGWDDSINFADSQSFEEAALLGQEQGLKGLSLKFGFSTLGYKYASNVEAMCRKAAHLLNAQREVPEICKDKLDFAMAERIFGALRAELFAESFKDKIQSPAQAALVKPEIRWTLGSL